MPLTCPRCGGDVTSQQPQVPTSGTLLSCPYCSSTLYCQQGFCLSHEAIKVFLEPTEAKGILRRWFRQKYNQVPTILDTKFQYLPFWVITDQEGEKHQRLAVTLSAKMPSPSLPEGHREPITPEIAAQKGLPPPTINLETVTPGKSAQEALLVWAPFYWVTFRVKSTFYPIINKLRKIKLEEIQKTQGAWVNASLTGISTGPLEPSSLTPASDPHAFESDFLPPASAVPWEIPALNLSPSGYGILGAMGGLSALVSFFSPHLILAFFAVLIISIGGFYALSLWGRSDDG